jgi:Fe-S-cluster-containing hydrogenase component 2
MLNLVCPKYCPLPHCQVICPSGAITLSEKDNNLYVETDKCSGCGLCRKACLTFSFDRNLARRRPWVRTKKELDS